MRKRYTIIIAAVALVIAGAAVAGVLRNGRPIWKNRFHASAINDCYKFNKKEPDIESCIKKIPFDGDWGIPPKSDTPH